MLSKFKALKRRAAVSAVVSAFVFSIAGTALPVKADAMQGSGTQSDPYIITSAQNLASIPSTDSNTPRVESIVTSKTSSYAITVTGEVYSWGGNSHGQLGIGNKVSTTTPTKIPGLSNICHVFVDDCYSVYAMATDGNIYSWGDNDCGQLGIGNTESTTIPVKIKVLNNVADILSYNYSVFALMTNGDIYSWGKNNYGQLGLGNTVTTATPAKISGLSNVSQLVSNNNYSLYAITTDGNAYSWGNNDCGQLGLGNKTEATTPTQISGLPDVYKITVNGNSIFADTDEDEVYAWGDNTSGKLGIKGDSVIMTPTLVPEIP